MVDYIKVKRTWKLLLLIILLVVHTAQAAEPPLLKPKKRSKKAVAEETLGKFQLDTLLVTPLGKEDFYEKRFSTLGGSVLFSIPVFKISDIVGLYGSLGAALTISRLSLAQGESSFTSMYLQFPLLAKAIFHLTPEMNLDLFLGAALRTTRFDSRSTTDGGTQKVQSGELIQPEFGLAVRYALSPTIGLKIQTSYLFFALGVSFEF